MHVLLGLLFTLRQALSFPLPAALSASPDGSSIAYVLDESGIRNLWFARAPDFVPRRLWAASSDDGQELTNLHVSRGGAYVVYVRGGDHDANWTTRPWPNPDSGTKEPAMTVVAIATQGASTPVALGDGDAPAISPDGMRVAFVHDPDDAIWSAPIDGSKAAAPLFFDRGKDGDLQWSPDGSALAFTSQRDDHSFVGVYRNAATAIRFLAPSTAHDAWPQWSPGGDAVAFVRTAGDG